MTMAVSTPAAPRSDVAWLGRLNAAVRYGVLIVVGLVMLYPLFWMVAASFKPNHEIFGSIGLWPREPTLDGIIQGWRTGTEYSFATYLFNSFAFIIPKVVLTVVSSVLVAYGFARFRMPGKQFWFALMVATILLPKSVLLIPQYLMFRQFGWLDTYLPLYVPCAFATEGFFVFMVVQFLRSIPPDMEEAAVIDGCNSIQVLWHVVVPILMPAIISVALFQFMWSLNDFLYPLIYLSSVEKYPVALALKMAIDVTEATAWNQVLAMSTIALLPSLVVFFLAQRYFVEGITSGAVKG
ncbi:carbohydrate ABC transporter permease [Niveispirillum fermenti]|uniref:carbohydrate ABC transporter permease n=2 Tax=Niveispirillum fermenti TaxID=1233113 RepID=UPI003A882A09